MEILSLINLVSSEKNRQLLRPGGIYYYTERQRELAEETKDNSRSTGAVWKISLQTVYRYFKGQTPLKIVKFIQIPRFWMTSFVYFWQSDILVSDTHFWQYSVTLTLMLLVIQPDHSEAGNITQKGCFWDRGFLLFQDFLDWWSSVTHRDLCILSISLADGRVWLLWLVHDFVSLLI